jgi:hypothetical protein
VPIAIRLPAGPCTKTWARRLCSVSVSSIIRKERRIAGASDQPGAAAQSERYCRGQGTVTRRMFTAEEGADMHCQLCNLSLSNAVVYDWLSEVLR